MDGRHGCRDVSGKMVWYDNIEDAYAMRQSLTDASMGISSQSVTSRILSELRRASIEDVLCLAMFAGLVYLGVML